MTSLLPQLSYRVSPDTVVATEPMTFLVHEIVVVTAVVLLCSIFEPFGEVVGARVQANKQSGAIEYATRAFAETAVQHLDNYQVGGCSPCRDSFLCFCDVIITH